MGIEQEADLTGVLDKYESIPAILKEVLHTMDLDLGLKLCKLIGTKVQSREKLERLLHLVRTQIGEVHDVPPDKINDSVEWLRDHSKDN